MKKKRILLILCAIAVPALVIGIFHYYHPTYYKFNDRFIMGKTEAEIIEKYGEFTKIERNESGEITYGTYMVRENTPEFVMSYDDSLWYEVYFENGIAAKIRLQEGWYGG